jgi:tetratricopeptide (TPR) repeat protein
MNSFLGLMRLHKQTNMIQYLGPNMQFTLNMMGHSKDPLVLTGAAMIEDQAMKEAEETQNLLSVAIMYNIKLQLSSYFQNYEMAEYAAKELAKCKQGTDSFPCFVAAARYLHEGITFVSLSSRKARQRIGAAKRSMNKLKVLAKDNPANFMNKVFLLEAEIAAAHHKVDEALTKFEESISHARREGMWNETGLACERAAIFLKGQGRAGHAISFLEQALSAYEQWGACAKVAAIKKILHVTLSSTNQLDVHHL